MSGIFKTIDPGDQTITPFKVYKSWEYTDTRTNRYAALASESIWLTTAIKPNAANFSDGIIPLDFDEECNLDPAAYLLNSNNNVPAGVVWHSLKHSYFNEYLGESAAAGAYPNINSTTQLETWRGANFKQLTSSSLKTYELIENELNPSSSCELGTIASVISIPQSKFGEEIKPGSLQIELTGSSNTQLITDDGNGNLVSSILTPVPKINNRLIYLGFNESEYDTIANTTKADPRYPTELSFYNVIPSRSFINTPSDHYGMAAYFSQSYIQIDGTPSYFNPNVDDNYAVSFWFRLNTITPGHGKNSHLVSKRSLFRNFNLINSSGQSTPGNIWRPEANITPYDIYVTQGGALQAQFGDGTTLQTLSTSGITANTNYHVVFQKTGSVYQLYLNGSVVSSASPSLTNITNKADIFVGCKGIDVRNNNNPIGAAVGRIDEVQIFNTFLTLTEISKLRTVNTLNNSYNVGKVFYKKGLIVITGLHSSLGSIVSAPDNLLFASNLYNNSSGQLVSNSTGQITNIKLRWNSTLTLYENEFLCRIREDEYNFTMNPSILKNAENSQLPKAFVYNDEFTPYITTIGLYNENAELLAIGKLAGPIKKRNNVDLNIIVRFDQ